MRETARAVGTNDVEGSTAPFPEIRLRGPEFFGGNTKFKGQRSMKAKMLRLQSTDRNGVFFLLITLHHTPLP